MGYLSWNEQTITDFSEANVNAQYNQGYVFTRKGKGVMNQTRSVRIDLSKFELSSENRRIVKKTEQLAINNQQLPYQNYVWQIGKLAHDFYETKFGKGTFSANKVKELLTDPEKSNFNTVFVYSILPSRPERSVVERSGSNGSDDPDSSPLARNDKNDLNQNIGYCIALETTELIHYSYPFYELRTIGSELSNIGLGMMLRAILYAKENGKKYIYLGSASRPTDTYKLQFTGIEWWDSRVWQTDLEKLKKTLIK
jgi:arginyl-tRNA--protein-N-Asp/Glu arginylyltransferase